MVHRGYPGSTNENVVVGKGHLPGSSELQFHPKHGKSIDCGLGKRSVFPNEPDRFRPVVPEPIDEPPPDLRW